MAAETVRLKALTDVLYQEVRHPKGSVVDVDPATARMWLRQGWAEPEKAKK